MASIALLDLYILFFCCLSNWLSLMTKPSVSVFSSFLTIIKLKGLLSCH